MIPQYQHSDYVMITKAPEKATSENARYKKITKKLCKPIAMWTSLYKCDHVIWLKDSHSNAGKKTIK